MSSPATNAWSVINLLRVLGVASATKSAIHTKWEAGMSPPQTTQTIDSARVDDGCAFLVAHGFATLVGSTLTATNIGADGRPKHLRRAGNGLEVLPDGEKVQDGT